MTSQDPTHSPTKRSPNGPGSERLDAANGGTNSADPPSDPPSELPPEHAGSDRGTRFRITHYDGNRMHVRYATWAEVQQLDHKSVDLYESEPEGAFEFRSHDGEWRLLGYNFTGLGPVLHAALHALQNEPGIFLDPSALADRAGISSLADNGNMAARIMRLRIILCEQGCTEPKFIRTRRMPRYGAQWPKAVTYIRVEMVTSNGASHHR